MTMKRLFVILTMLCLCAVTLWSAEKSEQRIIPIRIITGGKLDGITHRVPPFIPIQALYDDEESSITLYFLQDIGVVSIEIIYEQTGYSMEYEVDSIEESVNIPIIDNTGTAVINIIRQDTTIGYTGEFFIERSF